jgi:hypothetical protein
METICIYGMSIDFHRPTWSSNGSSILMHLSQWRLQTVNMLCVEHGRNIASGDATPSPLFGGKYGDRGPSPGPNTRKSSISVSRNFVALPVFVKGHAVA